MQKINISKIKETYLNNDICDPTITRVDMTEALDFDEVVSSIKEFRGEVKKVGVVTASVEKIQKYNSGNSLSKHSRVDAKLPIGKTLQGHDFLDTLKKDFYFPKRSTNYVLKTEMYSEISAESLKKVLLNACLYWDFHVTKDKHPLSFSGRTTEKQSEESLTLFINLTQKSDQLSFIDDGIDPSYISFPESPISGVKGGYIIGEDLQEVQNRLMLFYRDYQREGVHSGAEKIDISAISLEDKKPLGFLARLYQKFFTPLETNFPLDGVNTLNDSFVKNHLKNRIKVKVKEVYL